MFFSLSSASAMATVATFFLASREERSGSSLLDMALKVYGGGHTFESMDMAAYAPQGGEG